MKCLKTNRIVVLLSWQQFATLGNVRVSFGFYLSTKKIISGLGVSFCLFVCFVMYHKELKKEIPFKSARNINVTFNCIDKMH